METTTNTTLDRSLSLAFTINFKEDTSKAIKHLLTMLEHDLRNAWDDDTAVEVYEDFYGKHVRPYAEGTEQRFEAEARSLNEAVEQAITRWFEANGYSTDWREFHVIETDAEIEEDMECHFMEEVQKVHKFPTL